jgi:hypothetical protein
MSNDKSSNLWTIVLLLGLTLLLVVGYKIKNGLTPAITFTAPLDKSCDLRQGECQSKLPDGGKVSFSITPKTIPILRPLALGVNIKGVKVSRVEVDFIGIGMDMGYNRSKLKKADTNYFTGRAVIPVCVRSKMDWEARVLLYTKNGLIMIPFRFYTIK